MIFTIFGATGDLTTKKLIPALYNLYIESQLPDEFTVLGIGRRDYDDAAFIAEIEAGMQTDYAEWHTFKAHIQYYRMDFSDVNTFASFSAMLKTHYAGQLRDKIFYLATAPRFFPIIAEGLIQNQIVVRGDLRSKIVFEKPFGEDLASAKAYNRMLLQSIDESQVYRIDHYLGKEMLQNILIVRFANKIFENIWNFKHIDHIKIIAYESETVKQRGGYYDQSGALKDMVQNHLFQTLALVAMDSPTGLNDRLIKDEKVKVLQRIEMSDDILFGQYAGYLNEKGIPSDSKTETFAALKLYINTSRWQHTPFYLITGKKMDEKLFRIVITFKDSTFFFEKGQPEKNQLVIEVYPREGIEILFNGKAPGLQAYAMPMKLDYCHLCNTIGNTPEAYEKLILDVIHDDASLFTRWDEIEASWEIIDALEMIKQFEPLEIYENQAAILAKLGTLWKEVKV
ncbi:MAG: glucose-6-phosphate 1-dehydrogenase [Clostridiales bacterium]|jgi:glucose-6-phosphate 1-dehydrogenase|nr:glucose-6-phosphate 1-dehydrogenase [Clostridiales bacterium]MDN5298015.1 glucose-6-phosphate 1-dehydrogenase [Clostridiales bacterium]